MNNSQAKKIIFTVIYAALSALFIAAIFTNFLNVVNSKAMLPSLDGVRFGFSSLTDFIGSEERGNAVASIILLVLIAGIGIATAVLSAVQMFKKDNSKLSATKLWLFFAGAVAIFGLYGTLASLQFHFLSCTQGGAAITAFFVINLLTPPLFLIAGAVDNNAEIKNTFFVGGNFKKCFPTTFCYIAVPVLAVMFFVLPIYQYGVVMESNTVTFTYTLSFFGFNEFSSMSNFRSALLLSGCGVFAFIMFLTNCKLNTASDEGILKKIKTLRFVLCLLFAALFVFCFPSVMNFVTTCANDVADMSAMEVVTGAARGITFYAVIAMPVLTLLLCLCDGVQEFIRINSLNEGAATTKEIINSVISAVYTAIFILLFLSISLPYASYYLKDMPEVISNIYIINYRGVCGFNYINGVPAANSIFIYVVLAMLLASISIAILCFGKTKAAKGERASVVRKTTVGLKTAIATAFTIIFAYMQGYLPFYKAQISNATNATDSVLNMTPVSVFLQIAMITYLALVWIDLFVYLYYCYKEGKRAKGKITAKKY